MPPRNVHYVLSTHWDREWYLPFQDYRYRLVRLLDRILAGWNRDRLAGPFHTDGQAIPIEDYLEIRPERRAEIERRVREEKLIIGPWYVLPDEFLVSGEALVRNLQFGRQFTRDLGGQPSNAGFLCDMFGHNSQMPQIFAGFGIGMAFVWRGNNHPEQRLFHWRGADHSQVMAYRFGRIGYCDYAFAAHVNPQKNPPFDLNAARQGFKSFLEHEADSTAMENVLLFDGGDHLEWDEQAYQVVLEQIDSIDPHFSVAHTSLDTYLTQLLAEPQPDLPVLEGELREPAAHPGDIDQQWLIPGVLSSRVWIKQRNAACQAQLTQWAEPFSALAYLALGSEIPQGFLNTAWKWLLHNHPHDSICGCSIDAVHEDMKYRFAQSHTIAKRLTTEAARSIAAAAGPAAAVDELKVTVFNPLTTPLDEVVNLTLEIPLNWPVFGREMGTFDPQPAFRIFDAGGDEIPYQRISLAPNRQKFRTFDVRFPEGYRVTEVSVALPLHIAAVGYTTLTVRTTHDNRPTRHPQQPALASSPSHMENAFLAVHVQPNGTLTVCDKQTGQEYSGWLALEDSADIGDGWNFGEPLNNQLFGSAGNVSLALAANGAYQATLRIRATLDLPLAFDFNHMRRSEHFEQMVVDTWVTLRKDQKRLECESVVYNGLRDHRLRLLCPTGVQSQTYLADAPFDVVERPIALRADNHLYREMEVETKPQQTWTAVFDDQRGLAIVSSGLLESAVQDTPERSLALTLFRATGRTVLTNGEPQGQLQGEMRFRYWLAPLAGNPDRAALMHLGQLLEAGLTVIQNTPADQSAVEANRLPASGSLLSLSGALVITSIQVKSSALEVRLFNPNDRVTTGSLTLGIWNEQRWKEAQPVDLEGQPTGERLALKKQGLKLSVPPKRIQTYRFYR